MADQIVFRDRAWNRRVIWVYVGEAMVPITVAAATLASLGGWRLGAFAWAAASASLSIRFVVRAVRIGVYVDPARRTLRVVNPWRTYRFAFGQISDVTPHRIYRDCYVTELVTTFENRPFLAIGVPRSHTPALRECLDFGSTTAVSGNPSS